MQATGAITSYIDVAQVTLYAFWAFFAGLIFYLRREDKREGYPLVNDRSDRVLVQGFPTMPRPKTFLVRDGHTYSAPPGTRDTRPINAAPAEAWPGAPLRPLGNPLVDGVGPASWALRQDTPDLTAEGELRMTPLRLAPAWFVEPRDPDPRGFDVIGADGLQAGVVRDVWIDHSEPQIRYLEVALGGAATPNVLVPMTLARIDGKLARVRVKSINAHQFADAPRTANPDQVTLLEEDRIMAYFGGGHLYADVSRTEPLL